jgi:hypothetical protein
MIYFNTLYESLLIKVNYLNAFYYFSRFNIDFNKSYDKPWFYDAFSFANNLYIVPHILTGF